MHAVAARGEREGELGGDDPRAADGRVTEDPDPKGVLDGWSRSLGLERAEGFFRQGRQVFGARQVVEVGRASLEVRAAGLAGALREAGIVFAQQDYLTPEGLVALGAMLGLEVALDS